MKEQLIALAQQYAIQAAFFALYLVTVGVLGRKTQIETWVAGNPKLAFVVRILRAVTPDPWLLVKAFREYARQKAQIPPGLLVLFVTLSLAPSMSGCAGTLEETRGQIRVASPSARASGTCQALSSKERTWGGIAIGSAALAGTAGLSTIPLDSHAGDVGLAAGTAVLAATAATALSVQQSYGREWTREGCGQ